MLFRSGVHLPHGQPRERGCLESPLASLRPGVASARLLPVGSPAGWPAFGSRPPGLPLSLVEEVEEEVEQAAGKGEAEEEDEEREEEEEVVGDILRDCLSNTAKHNREIKELKLCFTLVWKSKAN